MMVLALLIIISVLMIINLWLSYRAFRKDNVKVSLEDISGRIESLIKDEFSRNRKESSENSKSNREELGRSLKDFNDSVLKRLDVVNSSQNKQLSEMRNTIETKLNSLQSDNNEKLEKMRETVDEKLNKTLEERLSRSFNTVSDRLKQVHEGLGEMQALASGVGDLKKVLSNVRTKGILGEIQLGNILEQILTTGQYERNVAVKKGNRENVEFAIKLPGRNENDQCVYLPLDSKFPLEIYHKLLNAHEEGNVAKVEEAAKNLENNIKRCAGEIRDKYINPPYTTDFGVMFLPIEGLYAEVVRRTSLIEILQRDFKIIITGPTTLAALLNSLQIGFRTLAIEKRSSEVWEILSVIKVEFDKFGGILKKAQTKIAQASDDIDELVGVRTRKIQRKLKDVQETSSQEYGLFLNETILDEESDESEAL